MNRESTSDKCLLVWLANSKEHGALCCQMPEDGNEILENGEEHVVEFSVTVVDAGYSALLHSEFPQYRRITQDLTQRVGEH